MTVVNHATVVGVFHDRRSAQQAVEELRRVGFREDQIGVVARDNIVMGATAAPAETSKWEEGAATGVAAGAGVGALWALGIAAGLLPPIGPIIAGGLLASVLASAAGGAAAGGILGALIGLGIPEEEARYYEAEFHSGRTLVTVQATGRYEEAREILRRFGGHDINTARAAEAAVTPPTSPAPAPSTPGEVIIHKDVVIEQRTVDIPVNREEVLVERDTSPRTDR